MVNYAKDKNETFRCLISDRKRFILDLRGSGGGGGSFYISEYGDVRTHTISYSSTLFIYYSKFDTHNCIDFHRVHCNEPTPLLLDNV